MISHLKGILDHKSPTEIVVDVNGVGYAVSIPLSTYEKLGETGAAVTILTYTHVREDILQLYGFGYRSGARNLSIVNLSVGDRAENCPRYFIGSSAE